MIDNKTTTPKGGGCFIYSPVLKGIIVLSFIIFSLFHIFIEFDCNYGQIILYRFNIFQSYCLSFL